MHAGLIRQNVQHLLQRINNVLRKGMLKKSFPFFNAGAVDVLCLQRYNCSIDVLYTTIVFVYVEEELT